MRWLTSWMLSLCLWIVAVATSQPSLRNGQQHDESPDMSMSSFIERDHVREAAFLDTDYPIAENMSSPYGVYDFLQAKRWVCMAIGFCAVTIGYVAARTMMSHSNTSLLSKGGLAAFYIALSAAMIESNKYLMVAGRYPYPIMLTSGHMVMSVILANILKFFCPSLFPAAASIKVTPRFCMKFLPVGIPFAMSLVCGNWAYKYLSVSFLQIMKQSNVVTIYILSAIVGLEAMKRTSSVILLGVLAGAFLGIKGELHFVWFGFFMQTASSLSEAIKVIMQSFLMSGESRLDPLTMVLFMAPACLLANLIPLYVIEGPRFHEIATSFQAMWPAILINQLMAFVLNVTVAQCIKQLSAVGYLLAGIVKDICIIATSTWLLGESLTSMQVAGFSLALLFVTLYSIYKRNAESFREDNIVLGFARVFGCDEKSLSKLTGDHEATAILKK
jgi:hypothetical protein